MRILFIFSFFTVVTTFAQNINYAGLFPTVDHSGKLSEKWSYNAYLFAAVKPYNHTNNFNMPDKARLLYIYGESGVSYAITEQLSFTASYVFEQQNPGEAYTRNENRLFQQLTLKTPINKLEIKQRLRFDERFIQNPISKEVVFTHRLRYLLGISSDINEKFYWFAYSEFFFNTKSNDFFKFNENWSALQLGYKINEKNSIECGLLYVGWIYNQHNDWFNQFYLQTTWVSKLDFSKN
ncbi:MAG: DUF2490 domain-containing protein [Flavobacteriales bacterium]